jgi:hypothetical protein
MRRRKPPNRGALAPPAPAYPVRPLSRAPEPELSPAAAALVAHGAPLLGGGRRPPGETTVEEAIALGVREAREQVALPRVLVVVIVKNKGRIRWDEVRRRLRRDELPVLGAMVDLAATAGGDEAPRKVADELHAEVGPFRRAEPFPSKPALARYARALGERTPREMRRWGSSSATPLDDYVDAVRKFG